MSRSHTPESFMEKWFPGRLDPHACWEWSGCRAWNGYGLVSYRKQSWQAHRLVWSFQNGAIPEGMILCHHCDNPPCCNPAHLFLGTQADNVRDMLRKGRGHDGTHVLRGEVHRNAKLTEDQVRAIRLLKQQGEATRAIARSYGIDPKNVRLIAARRTWAHVS